MSPKREPSSDVDFSALDRVGAEHAARMSASARLRLALQMMEDGLELERACLRRAHPRDGHASIEARLRSRLLADD